MQIILRRVREWTEVSFGVGVTALLMLMFCCLLGRGAWAQCGVSIIPEKELVITDLSVVNDARATEPGGKWTFGYLFRRIVGPNAGSAPEAVAAWLNEWAHAQTVNGFPVAPRPKIADVVRAWPKDQQGRLDLDRAPFRLLAIVNRLDVDNGPAGEGRFVFALTGGPNQLPLFTVIFEYYLPVGGASRQSVPRWAARWHELGRVPFGEAFNQRLETITEDFSHALSQVRTNELALGQKWEMREFRRDLRGNLALAPLAQTPDDSLNSPVRSGQSLAAWVRENRRAINAGVHQVPPRALGGAARLPMRWLPELANDPDPEVKSARQAFALQTCSGCHSSETTTGFMHVVPRRPMEPAILSRFMKEDLPRRAEVMRLALCGPSALRGGSEGMKRLKRAVH